MSPRSQSQGRFTLLLRQGKCSRAPSRHAAFAHVELTLQCNKPQETNQQNINQREWIKKWPAARALNQGGLCGSCGQLGKERDSKCSLRAGRLQLSALLDQDLGLTSRITGLTWAKGQPIFWNKCVHFILTTAFLHRRLLRPGCLCPLLTRLGDTVEPRCFLGTEGRSTPLCLCTSCSLPPIISNLCDSRFCSYSPCCPPRLKMQSSLVELGSLSGRSEQWLCVCVCAHDVSLCLFLFSPSATQLAGQFEMRWSVEG